MSVFHSSLVFLTSPDCVHFAASVSAAVDLIVGFGLLRFNFPRLDHSRAFTLGKASGPKEECETSYSDRS